MFGLPRKPVWSEPSAVGAGLGFGHLDDSSWRRESLRLQGLPYPGFLRTLAISFRSGTSGARSEPRATDRM